MARISVIPLAALAFATALVGCQKISRFPAPKPAANPKHSDPRFSPVASWIAPADDLVDRPIEFVSADKTEWKNLTNFWNEVAPPPSKTATDKDSQKVKKDEVIAKGPFDLGRIKIKVPLGLPDPTPLIPASNPPTYKKWQLGKKIFFEKVLMPKGAPPTSCADCHRPDAGFVDGRSQVEEGTRNTLSLLNVAFNREQFWDGRVHALEETLTPPTPRDDAGDKLPQRIRSLRTHNFPDVEERLNAIDEYRRDFKEAFGVSRVTKDAVAKALATYLRTILSGDSVYDRARAAMPPFKGTTPSVEEFKTALADDALFKRIAEGLPPKTVANRDELAALIVRGQGVFNGVGGCAACHTPGGLFTDQQYYNTSIGDSQQSQASSGSETGRFAVQPIGLKDFAMRGAYRTPTLRNLSVTGPYMHNGQFTTIPKVIEKYLVLHNDPLLAKPLLNLFSEDDKKRGSTMTRYGEADAQALWCYLMALDGQLVDPKIRQK